MRWSDMTGDDTRRFCHHCNLHVYNIAALTSAEAETLITRAEGRFCAQLFRRADGTVITKDCPAGVAEHNARNFRRYRASLAVAALLLGIAGNWAFGPIRWASAIQWLGDLWPFYDIAVWVGTKPTPGPFIGTLF
jgi:hypothetical protein